ncbi:uncharacterized protein LTR77_004992 [Saxophila tyrrhenica]|uniref:Uncharacterized protein n=1 Tax=Saxophila tyrrhenica TaxID=1690608 RepID=A0AAV9PD51_9PEZI|nr:hypothetical protein LTR77_004992 [Saxophila tyrrhenica]
MLLPNSPLHLITLLSVSLPLLPFTTATTAAADLEERIPEPSFAPVAAAASYVPAAQSAAAGAYDGSYGGHSQAAAGSWAPAPAASQAGSQAAGSWAPAPSQAGSWAPSQPGSWAPSALASAAGSWAPSQPASWAPGHSSGPGYSGPVPGQGPAPSAVAPCCSAQPAVSISQHPVYTQGPVSAPPPSHAPSAPPPTTTLIPAASTTTELSSIGPAFTQVENAAALGRKLGAGGVLGVLGVGMMFI